MIKINFKDLQTRFDDYRNKELPRLQKLFKYYNNEHKILNKTNRNSSKEDAKIVSGYPAYISTIATSFFLGKSINYKLITENEKEFDKLSLYLSTELEQKNNFEIAMHCSIFGKAYELTYIDKFKKIKSKALDPRDVFVIKDDTIDKNIIFAVRFDINYIENENFKVIMEVYDSRNITTYEYEATGKESTKEMSNAYEPVSIKPHGFKTVPIIEFLNNLVAKSDFENVITKIDAYNTAESTSIDDLTDFSDSYLVMENMQGTDEEDISKIKKDKILLTGEDGKVYWLTKQVNDVYSQNIKERLNSDIHKFSFTPDMTDEKFSGNTSGVALEFKLLPLEQLVAQKEMYFKHSLNERLELYIQFLELNISAEEIQKVFTRNLPKNLKEISETMKNIKGLVSDKTMVSLFPAVEDVQAELDTIKEDGKIYEEYNNLNNE